MISQDDTSGGDESLPDDEEAKGIESQLPETACSVCGSAIHDPTASNLCFVTLEPDDPLKLREAELQGTEIDIRFIKTPDLNAVAFYMPRDSLARKAGFDLMFVLCGARCGVSLAEAIVRDESMFSKLLLQ